MAVMLKEKLGNNLKYNSNLENFIDGVDFTCKDPCVWIVYPAGAAGDLLASIINFHYGRTGCYFFGIMDNGQVIFRPSDSKHSNKKFFKDGIVKDELEQLVWDTNTELGKKNLNYSLIDQIIFSNHYWRNIYINPILDFFSNVKIIRILPLNTLEQEIIIWLEKYKNQNQLTEFNAPDTIKPLLLTTITDPRLLDIHFGSLLNENQFENTYKKIIKHLDLDYKLIRFDYIKHWLSKQHPIIQPILKTL